MRDARLPRELNGALVRERRRLLHHTALLPALKRFAEARVLHVEHRLVRWLAANPSKSVDDAPRHMRENG